MTALLLLVALSQPPAPDPAVKSVVVRFAPSEAQPGQTVTLLLTVTLTPGHHTYPTRQPDKSAAAYVTKLKFPDAGPVVFVGDLVDPAKFDATAEPELGIKELRTVAGSVVFTRKLVVNPAQPAGPLTVTLPEVRLTVCTAKECLPPRVLKPSGKLTVLPGPAAAVEPKYAEAVKKALAGL